VFWWACGFTRFLWDPPRDTTQSAQSLR
jgi:hypothetical protein